MPVSHTDTTTRTQSVRLTSTRVAVKDILEFAAELIRLDIDGTELVEAQCSRAGTLTGLLVKTTRQAIEPKGRFTA